MKVATLFFVIWLSLICSSVFASVSSDEEVRVVVETQNGKVAWSKIAEAVSKEIGADIPLLGQVPAGELAINEPSTRLVLWSVNRMLQPTFRISIDRRNKTVIVRINKTKVESALKQLKKQLSARSDEAGAAGRVSGLRPFHKDRELENAKHIVLLVHGFNSSTSRMNNLAKAIEKDLRKKDSGVEVACFDYASHDGVSLAAKSLEASLQTIIDKNPDCSISLVTHSLGGVVSRVMIERDGFAMSQLKRLIMIAPPNHGTQLASLPSGNASFDSLLAKIDRIDIRKALQSVVSTTNIAVEDVKPGSKCLQELNTRKRNASVDYSIILGDVGILSASEAKLLRQFAKKLRGAEIVGSGANDLNSILETLPLELITGKGDGVVSVESGKLSGVDDTIVMSFKHNELLRDNTKSQGKIIRQILKRLKPSKKITPSK